MNFSTYFLFFSDRNWSNVGKCVGGMLLNSVTLQRSPAEGAKRREKTVGHDFPLYVSSSCGICRCGHSDVKDTLHEKKYVVTYAVDVTWCPLVFRSSFVNPPRVDQALFNSAKFSPLDPSGPGGFLLSFAHNGFAITVLANYLAKHCS